MKQVHTQNPNARSYEQHAQDVSSHPTLLHHVRSDRSILALAVSGGSLFAGTESGKILVLSLETYGRIHTIEAHQRSVLSLYVPQDHELLFSSAGDAIVNVWHTQSFDRLYSIYSTYDVGDVFCVVYSTTMNTVYLGAQNTSIQWYNLADRDNRSELDRTSHPFYRNHRFFDSKGPGGAPAHRRKSVLDPFADHGQLLEIDRQSIVQYAHYGYTYCMLLHGGTQTSVFNEQMLISGGGDGSIKIWSINKDNGGSIAQLKTLESGDESVLTLALDGILLYSGRSGGEINVWDLETCQLLRRLQTDAADVLTLCSGGGSIFSGSANGIARQFDAQYEQKYGWQSHERLILTSLVTELQGKKLYVTGGNDNVVAVWDVGQAGRSSRKASFTSNDRLLVSLSEFVALRTVSSKPEFAQDCRRGASWLKCLLKDFGADTEMLSTTENTNPVVYARFRGIRSQSPNKDTILFYGHYDVVEADDKQKLWASDPFKMRGFNGYLYGRGVTDNKGPILAAIYAVAELFAEKTLNADVVFLIEGEEEHGSRGFRETIQKHKELIGEVNWILLGNSYWLNDSVPCLTYGLRGVVHATILVESDRPNLHSGIDGSQRVSEAMKDLIQILASLSNDEGVIKIPGFYDPVLGLGLEEERRYTAISQMLLSRNGDLGDAHELADQLKGRWREPSLTIHRITSSGSAGSSVIPHTATAVLSLRLVPNQSTSKVQKALKAALQDAFNALASSNKLRVRLDHAAEPWLGDPDNEIFQALEKAIVDVWGPLVLPRKGSQSTVKPRRRSSSTTSSAVRPKSSAFGTSDSLTNGSDISSQATADLPTSPTTPSASKSWKPLFIREGGSIPAIRFLEELFSCDAAQLPCGQASDNAHLDNERIRLSNLYKSKDIFKRVFRDLPRA
ncbi:MAG: hypothetical protein Q9183_003015 [Haloplaca sp. 2 TL-2023]